jgi:hypothetical protein
MTLRRRLAAAAVPLMLGLTACGDRDDSGSGETAACELAEDNADCPECYSGEVTCTYEGYSETAGSCGDCQARSALLQTLCDEGVEDDADTIEVGIECSDPE